MTQGRTPTAAPFGQRRRRAGVAVLLCAALVAAGCSGDEEPTGAATPTPSASAPPPPVADPGALRASLGSVAGTLRGKGRKRTVRQVGKVVDGWVEAAYAGDYPRSSYGGAFADFTKGAKRQVRRHRDVLSNAGIGERIDGVEITGRRVVVDVLANQRRLPAAATARVRVDFTTTGEVAGAHRVKGRLFLTKQPRGWKVFGFDMTRGDR